jgi:hypothetical protein
MGRRICCCVLGRGGGIVYETKRVFLLSNLLERVGRRSGFAVYAHQCRNSMQQVEHERIMLTAQTRENATTQQRK